MADTPRSDDDATADSGDEQRRNSGENDRDASGRFLPANSHSWQKGQSGNPRGRPKAKTLTERILEELDKPAVVLDAAGKPIPVYDGETGDPLTKFDVVVNQIVERAARGDVKMLQEIGDRIDPKARRIEHSGPDGRPIQVEDMRGMLIDRLQQFAKSRSNGFDHLAGLGDWFKPKGDTEAEGA